MQFPRRTVLAAFPAAPAAVLLAGCGTGDGATGDPAAAEGPIEGELTMWMYPMMPEDKLEPYWNDIRDAFQQEHPDVKLEIQYQPWKGRAEAVANAVAANVQPDIIYFNPDYVAQYADMDALVDVTELLEPAATEKLNEPARAGMSVGDALYGLPILQTVNSSLFNKKIMDEVGIEESAYPVTWDELRATAATLKENGYYLTTYEGALENSLLFSFFPYLWQNGGTVFTEDGTAAAFAGQEGVGALEFIKEMVDNGWVPKEPLTTAMPLDQSDFAAGRVAYYTGEVGYLDGVMPPEDVVVKPPMKNTEQVGFGSVGGLSIMEGTQALPAAVAFLNFLATPENLTKMLAESRGYYPATSEITELYEPDTALGIAESTLDLMNPGPNHPNARDVHAIVGPHIQSVLLNGEDPQTALEAAAAEVDALLGR